MIPLCCAALLSLLFASCASAPKAASGEPTAEAGGSAVPDGSAAGGSGSFIPEEPAPILTDEDLTDNATALERAAAAREAALAAGADKAAAVQFAAADAQYKALAEAAETDVNVSLGLEDVQRRFEALELYAKALAAKARADELDFAQYDQSAYDSGTESLDYFEHAYTSPNSLSASMLETAGSADGSFRRVLFSGFKKLAKDERTAAFSAKLKADGVRAGVAAKSEYNQAVEEFRAGDSSYAMQNPESAYNHYRAAGGQFASLFESVSELRAAAQKAIDEAKERAAESMAYAQAADEESPLSDEDVEGIEAADAKLLEDDVYESPESQEAEIPSEVDDDGAAAADGADEALADGAGSEDEAFPVGGAEPEDEALPADGGSEPLESVDAEADDVGGGSSELDGFASDGGLDAGIADEDEADAEFEDDGEFAGEGCFKDDGFELEESAEETIVGEPYSDEECAEEAADEALADGAEPSDEEFLEDDDSDLLEFVEDEDDLADGGAEAAADEDDADAFFESERNGADAEPDSDGADEGAVIIYEEAAPPADEYGMEPAFDEAEWLEDPDLMEEDAVEEAK